MKGSNGLVSLVRTSHLNYPPWGLIYCAEALRQAGFEARIHFYSWGQANDVSRCVDEILEGSPAFVGLSVWSVETAMAAALSREIKRRNGPPVVWGGIHPSLSPHQCLEEDFIDYIVLGEGEETIVEFAQHLGNGGVQGIRGVGYKTPLGPRINPERPFIRDLDRFDLDPKRYQLDRYLHQRKHAKREILVVTSRGCPSKCGFCYNMKFNSDAKGNPKYRAHSVEYVAEYVRRLKKDLGIDSIVFMDDEFFASVRRALGILRQVDIPFRAELRVDTITPKLVEEFRSLRCRELMFGWESGTDRMLDLMTKGFRIERTLETMEILAKAPEIAIAGSGIVCFPTETREEVEQTFRFAAQLARMHPRFMTQIGTFLPYPGVPLTALAEKEGGKLPKRTEDWENYGRYRATDLDLGWVHWLKPRDREWLETCYKYVNLCSRYYGDSKAFPRHKAVVGKLMFRCSYFRLIHNFMKWPLETFLYFNVWGKIKAALERRRVRRMKRASTPKRYDTANLVPYTFRQLRKKA